MDEFDLKTEEGDNDYYQDDGPLDGVDGAEGQYQDYQEDPLAENGGADSTEANGNGANGEGNEEQNPDSNPGSEEQQQTQQSTTSNKTGKSKDDDKRKLFVGGLSWDTKEKDLKEYFSKFGEVEGLTYKTDAMTGRPRGFAFIIFTELSSVEQVLATGEHVINGKKVDPKRAKARPGKIFVGGLTPEISNEDVKEYFAQFGTVVDMEVPIDKSTNQRKNYCFVTFDDIAVSQELLKQPKQNIGGKEVDVKQAQPQQRAWEGGPGGGRGAPRGGRGARGGGRGGAGSWAGYGGGYGGAPGYGYDYYGGGGGWGGYEGYGGGDYYGGGGYGYEGYAAPRPRGRGGFVGKVRGGLTRGAPRHAPY